MSRVFKPTLIILALSASSAFAGPPPGEFSHGGKSGPVGHADRAGHCPGVDHLCKTKSFAESKDHLLDQLNARKDALSEAVKCIEAAQSPEALRECRPNRGHGGLKRDLRSFHGGAPDGVKGLAREADLD